MDTGPARRRPHAAGEPAPTPANPPKAVGFAVEYRLDDKDRIVAVNEDWRRFASANGGPGLAPEQVVGRSLRDFISGDVTRMFVDTLLQSVRLTGRERKLAYRCDSPEAKRYMEMVVAPAADGGIVSRHRLVREERFAAAIPFVASPGARRALVKRCSMCNRLSRNGGELVEADVARREGWLAPVGATPVIYFVCPACRRLVEGQRARP